MQAIQSPWMQIQILDFALQFLKQNTQDQQLQTICFAFLQDCHFSLAMIVVKSTLTPGSSLAEKHIQMPYKLKFPRLDSRMWGVHLVHQRQIPFIIGVLGCTFKYQTSAKKFWQKTYKNLQKLIKVPCGNLWKNSRCSTTKEILEFFKDLNFFLNGSKCISVQFQRYTYI